MRINYTVILPLSLPPAPGAQSRTPEKLDAFTGARPHAPALCSSGPGTVSKEEAHVTVAAGRPLPPPWEPPGLGVGVGLPGGVKQLRQALQIDFHRNAHVRASACRCCVQSSLTWRPVATGYRGGALRRLSFCSFACFLSVFLNR